MDQTLHKTTMTRKQYRLICRIAVGSLPTGYARVRVFFADEATALAAGYRPCANDIASALKASLP